MPSLSRHNLERAAFWEHEVCTECFCTFEFPAEDGSCPECGAHACIPATAALALIEEVEAND